MDLTKSSYDFHCGLESPLEFFRREWKAIAIFGGGFCLLMLAGIILVDPAFYYPRLQTDPLLYYLKAKSLVETGTTAARLATNSRPFAYAAMAGVLRAPALLAFRDFDDQWRAMQLLNIPIVAGVALMSAYIVSWTQPVRRHWMAIAFAFGFTAISPIWLTNVYMPLADAPYAAFSLLGLLVAIHVLCRKISRDSVGWTLLFIILFVVVFLLRFTGPVMLVFFAALAWGRWQGRDLTPAQKRTLIALPIALLGLLALLVSLNTQAIFGKYLHEPFVFARYAEKSSLIFNLLGVALPDQIIPDFHLGFSAPPLVGLLRGEFGRTAFDRVLTTTGIGMSATIALGMWRLRSRILPEILYVLAPLPVLALMMPSTSRYFISYQAFFWLMFIEGITAIAMHVSSLMPRKRRSRSIVGVSVLLAVIVAGALRWSRVAGTAAERSFAISMQAAPRYEREVSRTFRSLRNFLATLPKDQTLLIGTSGTVGRWNAIGDHSYYSPDSALLSVSATKRVYLVVECGTRDFCQLFSETKNHIQDNLCRFGEFNYARVFAVSSDWARAEVFLVTPAA